MHNKTILLYLFSISVFLGLNNCLNGGNSTFAPSGKVTIFIHGTRMIRFFPLNISSSLKNFDALFSTPQLGLHHYSSVADNNNQVRIAKTLHQADPDMFPLDTFYFFGWSGKLSIAERRQTAAHLAQEIQTQIIQPYQEKYGIKPSITLITHSHGGNVVLNLARQKDLLFTIDRLIMLACPVQQETMKFIHAPIFKTVYSFYSDNDTLQVLDPQLFGTINHGVYKAFVKRSTNPLKKLWHKLVCPFFSLRQFHTTPTLYQINVAWKDSRQWSEADFDVYGPIRYLGTKMTLLNRFRRKGLDHIEFLIPTFIQKIPAIIKEAQTLQKDFTFYLS